MEYWKGKQEEIARNSTYMVVRVHGFLERTKIKITFGGPGKCHPANQNHFFSVEIKQGHILFKQLKLKLTLKTAIMT